MPSVHSIAMMSKTTTNRSLSGAEFESYASSLLGMPLTRLWQGYGSAIFPEFGRVQPRERRDGSPGNPCGEYSLMLQNGWRIEGKRRIWCGSWSDGERWPRAFKRIEGATASSVKLFGRLPEIDLGLFKRLIRSLRHLVGRQSGLDAISA